MREDPPDHGDATASVPRLFLGAKEQLSHAISEQRQHQHQRQHDDETQQPSDESAEEKGPHDVPPDGGYGWVCVACSACINGNTWGVNSSYGVFLSYYLTHDLFPNTSPIEYAFTGGLSMSCCLLIAPLVTYLVRLYGNRAILNVGVCVQTASFIGASFATQKWHVFLSQGVCFGFGMGLIFIACVGITPQWFLRKRSIATSLAAAGSGLGGLAYSLAAGALLSSFGLGWTFRVLGLTSMTINLIAVNLMRDRNKAVGSKYRAFHFPLLKRPEFLLLQAWGALSLLGYVVVLFSLPNFAISIGLSSHQGSIVGAVLNLGQAVGRPVVGFFSDRFGRLNMATFCSILCGIFCLAIWIPTLNMGVLCFFAIIVGTVAGTFWTTVSPVCAEIIGLPELPAGLSIIWVLMVPPTTVAEPIGVVLKDDSKTAGIYLYAQIFSGLVYIFGGLCLWVVRGWKIGDNQRIAEARARNIQVSGRGLIRASENPGATSVMPVMGSVDQAITEEKPAAGSSVNPEALPTTSQSTTGMDVRIWAPAPLARRMITWARV